MLGRKNSLTVMSYWDLSSRTPDDTKSTDGTYVVSFSVVVHFCGSATLRTLLGEPSGAATELLKYEIDACCEARKLERRAFVSSVFDFSELGCRIMEGPPLIILLSYQVNSYGILK